MRDEPRIRRSGRNALLTGAFLVLALGTSHVFSQAPEPPADPDPVREVLLLKKAALEAEIKASSARVVQAIRRLKNAQVGSRSGLQSDDYILNAEADLADRQAILARKRVDLKETTNRIEGHALSPSQGGSAVDVTDDLLRRIKDLEARVDRMEASGREFRLRAPGTGGPRLNQQMFFD